MNIAVLLEVGIGLIFIWVLLSLITSAILDWVSQVFKWRADMLMQAIGNLLTGKDMLSDPVTRQLVEYFYNQPLIKGLHSNGGKRLPSQIPSKQFASAIFDVIIRAGTDDSPANRTRPAFERLQESLNAIRNLSQAEGGEAFNATKASLSNLAQTLDALLVDVTRKAEEADHAITEARDRVEEWFNDAMDRVGGAYKRRAQIASLVVGITLATAINADALSIADTLWRQPIIREVLVSQAESFQLPEGQTAPSTQQIVDSYNDLQGLSVPLGWSADSQPINTAGGWVLKVTGILLSGIAAAQGAPFWFDMMRKLISLRSGSSSEAPKG
jgi:ElaB/YqjD/DUF883 family membrane-anchored ribosome-binding protein